MTRKRSARSFLRVWRWSANYAQAVIPSVSEGPGGAGGAPPSARPLAHARGDGLLQFRRQLIEPALPGHRILGHDQRASGHRTNRISAHLLLTIDDASRSINDRLHDARVDRIAAGGAGGRGAPHARA